MAPVANRSTRRPAETFIRLRCGGGQRRRFVIKGCSTAELPEREARLRELARLLVQAKQTQDGDREPGNVVIEIQWPDGLDADVDLWVQAPGDTSPECRSTQ